MREKLLWTRDHAAETSHRKGRETMTKERISPPEPRHQDCRMQRHIISPEYAPPGRPSVRCQLISFGLLKGRRYSDNILAIATKPVVGS